MSAFRLRCLREEATDEAARSSVSARAATATPATAATDRDRSAEGVALVADVAIAGAARVLAQEHSSLPLERRRRRVLRDLAAHPEQRVAADVADAPLRPEPGPPVSVVIACRTPAGIVSAELRIPRERFDAALFLATLAATSERPS